MATIFFAVSETDEKSLQNRKSELIGISGGDSALQQKASLAPSIGYRTVLLWAGGAMQAPELKTLNCRRTSPHLHSPLSSSTVQYTRNFGVPCSKCCPSESRYVVAALVILLVSMENS